MDLKYLREQKMLAAIWNALIASPRCITCRVGRAGYTPHRSLPPSLYGQELDEATTPLEAGLDRFVSQAGGFSGAEALEKQRADGPTKTLVMIEMIDRGIPRHGYEILDRSGNAIGEVTSGTTAPYLKKNIAMGYVPPNHSEIGDRTRHCDPKPRPQSANCSQALF